MADTPTVPPGIFDTFQGLPCVRLALGCGDTLRVSLHGAQVLSWVTAGRERLYLSPRALLDGQAPIRGGVPVCFPQFNQRGPQSGLPKHGFARQLPWQVDRAAQAGDEAHVVLRLESNVSTQRFWEGVFSLALTLTLRPGCVHMALEVRNPGLSPWAFTGALHTYVAVDDIAQVSLAGLQGCHEWDAVADDHGTGAPLLRFDAEFDRVYDGAMSGLVLCDGAHRLQISKSASFDNVVVWNPGPERCATLPDLPPEGFRRMLCVEAAQVYTPVQLPAGAAWQGWQQLQVL